ncbi:MAG: hypothetical protein WEE89_20340 [Gemmatimonadota bacterium]
MEYWNRVKVLARWGLICGAILGSVVALVSLSHRSTTVHIGGVDINLLAAVALYVVGGALAGIIVGLCFPLIRRRLGAAFVGVLGIAPLSLGAVATYTSFGEWQSLDTETVIVTSLVLGIGAGLMYRSIFHEEIEKESKTK